VLQHGTLPIHGDITRILAYLDLSDLEREAQRQVLRSRATTIEESLGRPVSFAQVSAALEEGFSQALGLRLERGEPTASERALADQLWRERYAEPGWTGRM
jgi:lipoate-protein ligase A